MGLFDNLLAPFNTSSQDKASADQISAIKNGLDQFGNFADAGRGALTGNYTTAAGQVQGAQAAGGAALTQGADNAMTSLTGSYGLGSQLLGNAYQSGIAGLGSAYAQGAIPLQQNFQTGQAGTQALGNALGLNGAQGNADATAAFWNNPAIQSQLNIGSENVMRHAAATGGPASGSTLTALQDYGQQVASQGWNNYVSQLQPYLNFSGNAASGLGNLYSGYGNQLAGTYSNLGNQQAGLYQGLGNQLAGVSTGLGQGLNQNAMTGGALNAGLYQNLGNQLNASYTNQGNAAYGANASMGQAQANADLAPLTAGKNIWDTAVGAAGAAVGSPTGTFGTAGKLASGLYNTATGSSGPSGSGLGPIPSTFNWSDARVKDDIRPIGKLADGLNVYAFRYKGSPKTEIGLIAQEVEQVVPDAVIKIGGIRAVDYNRATNLAGELMKRAA